jgi:hypothetical protein
MIVGIPWKQVVSYEISDLHREVDGNCALLGCYAPCGGNFLPTFRDNLPVPSSRAKKFEFLTLEDGPGGLSRNVGKHQTLRNSPEEQSSLVISWQAEFVLNITCIRTLFVTDLVTLFKVLWVSWPVELVEVTVFWREPLLPLTSKKDKLLQKVSNSYCFDTQIDIEGQ